MKVRVELQAYLEQYSPNGQDLFDYEVPDGSRVRDLVVKLGMPPDLASVIIVGNTNADPTHALNEGDRVTLIPPLAGGDGRVASHVWPVVLRIGTIAGIVGGLLFLLLLVVSVIALMPGAGGRGGQSINHEPVSLEQGLQLIDTGQVYLVAIRKKGNMDEYFLLDQAGYESRKWNVEGIDVHVFTESMDTGVPILSDDPDEVGLTSDQFDELLQHVDQFNAASSWQIDVLDQREQ